MFSLRQLLYFSFDYPFNFSLNYKAVTSLSRTLLLLQIFCKLCFQVSSVTTKSPEESDPELAKYLNRDYWESRSDAKEEGGARAKQGGPPDTGVKERDIYQVVNGEGYI